MPAGAFCISSIPRPPAAVRIRGVTAPVMPAKQHSEHRQKDANHLSLSLEEVDRGQTNPLCRLKVWLALLATTNLPNS
jgi:hypothetical protein